LAARAYPGENELLGAKQIWRSKLASRRPVSGEMRYPDIKTVVPYGPTPPRRKEKTAFKFGKWRWGPPIPKFTPGSTVGTR
jgi:hypothetical protein